MAGIKSYIRGFNRHPIDTLRYAASTNFFLACAANTMAADGAILSADLIDVDWHIFNEAVFVTVFYKIP